GENMPQPEQHNLETMMLEAIEFMYQNKQLLTYKSNSTLYRRSRWKNKLYDLHHFHEFLQLCIDQMRLDRRGIPKRVEKEWVQYIQQLPFTVTSVERVRQVSKAKIKQYMQETHSIPQFRTPQVGKELQRLVKHEEFGYEHTYQLINECIQELESVPPRLQTLFDAYQDRFPNHRLPNALQGKSGLLKAIDEAKNHMFSTGNLIRSSDQDGDRFGMRIHAQVKRRKEEWGITGWAEFLERVIQAMQDDPREIPLAVWDRYLSYDGSQLPKMVQSDWYGDKGRLYALSILLNFMKMHKRLPSIKTSRNGPSNIVVKKIRRIYEHMRKVDHTNDWGISSYPELLKTAIGELAKEDEALAAKLEVLLERKYDQSKYK
ncbi:MAG: hypothetical protein ACXAB7_23915, partial [Candidatus Kariarchaeaceae archaeon]